MILTLEETTWVCERLNRHDIKYQEVYDELKDHLLTSIENLRMGGDHRPIEQLYQEVVKTQFPGWWPFEDIVKQYQQSYSRKISKALWRNVWHYVNWQTVPAMLIAVVAGFYLPDTKVTIASMMVALLSVSILPQVYIYRAGRSIRTEKGKESLVKNYVNRQANFLIIIINIMFNLVATLSREWKPASFLNPTHYPPILCMGLLCFFIVYGLGCMRLSRQEFKLA